MASLSHLAFLIISYAHVIIGEVVPKNLAIQKADRVAVLFAARLCSFSIASRNLSSSSSSVPPISSCASPVLSKGSGHGGHSTEELKYIIQSSRRDGHLQQFEQDAIQRLIELSDYSAREIMTPRHNIVSLPVDAPLDQVLAVMSENKFSRVPVYEDRPEQIIGIVHYKDLMRVWDERRFAHDNRRTTKPFRLRRFVRKPTVVPETKPLNQLVDEFRTTHTHMALVVDEFGTISGLVTLEDVLEQIFGDIGDEHDSVRIEPSTGEKTLELEGTTTIRDLETRYNVALPAEAGFETLAGFLLYQFGYIPNENEHLDYGGRRFTITRMDRNRITSVTIEKLDHKSPPDAAKQS